MLKFLRRYQLWILAIGGSLLMIAFLLPEAINQLGRMGVSPTVATVTMEGKPRTIRSVEWSRHGMEVGIVEALIPDIHLALGFPQDPDRSRRFPSEHWFLLTEEARRAGLIGGPREGRDFIHQFAGDYARIRRVSLEAALTELEGMVVNEARRAGLRADDGFQAFSNLVGVLRLLADYRGASLPADYRVRQLAADFEHAVNVSVMVVSADRFLDDAPEPTEEELLAHFEQWRDAEPGTGRYGIGYRLDDRAQIEFLTIDYRSIIEQIPASGLEARRWYNENRDQVRPDYARGQEEPPPFDEVVDDLILAYKRSEAEKKLDEIARFIRGELLRTWQPLPRDDDYRTLPEDWEDRRISFEVLRERLQEKFNIRVSYTARTDWLKFHEIAVVPDIGAATRTIGQQRASLSSLVRSHREFDQIRHPGLQAGMADPNLLRGQDQNQTLVGPWQVPGDAYLYRVTAVDPSRPPESLDEVREEVVRDVKRLHLFERLAREDEEWLARATEEGLEELAESLETRLLSGRATRYDTRQSRPGEFVPTSIAGLPVSAELTEAIIGRARELGPLTRFEEIEKSQRLLAVPVPQRLGLVLVRLNSQQPLARERWESLVRDGLRLAAIRGEPTPLSQAVVAKDFRDHDLSRFSLESLKVRYEFEFVERRRRDDERAPMLEDMR